jgi:hypothetical protein
VEKKNDPVSIIKVWLFPAMVMILSTIIWQDVKELKNDVKQLLAQSNIDKTRIDALERQIDVINQMIMQERPADGRTPAIPTQKSMTNVELTILPNKKKYGKYIQNTQI